MGHVQRQEVWRNCADFLASYGVPEALTIYSVLHDYYRAA
jgi:hypothetical protein